MKKLSILFFTLIQFSIFAQKDPVVMTINNKKVTKSEFLQVYLKNNNDPKFDKASLDEYVQLFKNFKLKVAEAEALGYDTMPQLKRELEGYRKQLARPYLVDDEKNEALVREAYDRMQYEIDASHILVKVNENATPKDTLEAYQRIMALKKRIEQGEDFGEVAASKRGSEDPSAVQNKGNLGYFTAFQMVYPFESAAYNTPVGQIGGPVRTKYGYHLLKVHDKRPARGAITTAHIMVAVRDYSSAEERQNAEQKILEIHQKLMEGEDFAKLARLYSDDTGSKQKGGKLPTFGTGTSQRMVPAFEDAAYALTEDNQFSEPFRTDFGFHIVKRLDYTPLNSFEEMEKSISSKVAKGDRGQQSQSSFIAKLKKENKFKDRSAKHLQNLVTQIHDSSVIRGNWEGYYPKKNPWIFRYAKQKYDLHTFVDYLVANQKRLKRVNPHQFVLSNYSTWRDDIILAKEESTLEDKHPSFRNLLREYHDGVLLYEIMKNMVWDKSVQDTAGLQNFFLTNKENYRWPNRVHANVYTATSLEIAQQTKSLIESNDSLTMREVLAQINSDSQLNVAGKSDKFELGESFLIGKTLQEGLNPIFELEENFYIIEVLEFLPETYKTLREARGSAIQDYQNYLEMRWLEELRQKHKINVDHEVLYSISE